MEYKPHDYQQFAINYILEHPIAAVILGMGLGKTSITLTAIEQLIYDSFEVSKVLVVAPLRVARNTWSDEIHKWDHLKHLRYSIVLGSAAERKKALEADADIYIIICSIVSPVVGCQYTFAFCTCHIAGAKLRIAAESA